MVQLLSEPQVVQRGLLSLNPQCLWGRPATGVSRPAHRQVVNATLRDRLQTEALVLLVLVVVVVVDWAYDRRS